MQDNSSLEEIVTLNGTWFDRLSDGEWIALGLSIAILTLSVMPYRHVLRKFDSLRKKTFLAAGSGILCYGVYQFGFDDIWPAAIFYAASGVLFAAGVLYPYVDHSKAAFINYIALSVVSTASYWTAIEIVASRPGMPDWRAYMLASMAGATIVLLGARFIIPLRNSLALTVFGLVAAIIGSFFFVLPYSYTFPHLFWHSLMAIAIHAAINWPRNLAVRTSA